MGREIKRVPLDFNFEIGKSYADSIFNEHYEKCQHRGEEDFDHGEKCGYKYWSEVLPKGDGWQLWQTVSDGPISPVFKTAEELIDWMCQGTNDDRFTPWAQGWSRAAAEGLVKGSGWIPSMIVLNGRILSPEEMVKEMNKP